MLTKISNGSFETAFDSNHKGFGSDWLFACTAQSEYASFADGVAFENFEDGWPGLLVTELSLVATAAFGAAGASVESFEREWLSNEFYAFGLDGVQASFDTSVPESLEDFEEEWSSNEGFLNSFVGVGTDLAAAAFDASPEAYEDFEEGWNTNESYLNVYVGVGTDLAAASFDVSPEAYEDFEEDWTTTMVSV